MNEPFTILFVCTGNYCRSPLAEALFRCRLQKAGLDKNVIITSAGTCAVDDMPASSGAIHAAKQYEIDLHYFRSHQLTEDICKASHLIIVMDTSHLDWMETTCPQYIKKAVLLGKFLPGGHPMDIPDPIGTTHQYFLDIAKMMSKAFDSMIENWDDIKRRFYVMQKFVIALGADHRGVKQKNIIKEYLEMEGYQVIDAGTNSEAPCDHPDYAFKAGELVSEGKADRVILVCSTGHGMLLAVNKVHGIMAVMPINEEHAKLSRLHNNANGLCFGADFMSVEKMKKIMKTWLETNHLGGKYSARVKKILDYENEKMNKSL